VKDFYSENYKTLIKEIEDKRNGNTSQVHGLKELRVVKCLYYLKGLTGSVQSPSKYR
jgi:hypothetical protein